MIIWHPYTYQEFLDLQEQHYKNGNGLRLVNYQHLGDEKEPMELFEWGDSVTKALMLRSTLTVNRELYWRVE